MNRLNRFAATLGALIVPLTLGLADSRDLGAKAARGTTVASAATTILSRTLPAQTKTSSSEKKKAQQKKRNSDVAEEQFPPPVIAVLFPAGASQGQTIEALVTGTDLKGTDGVRVTGQGVSGTVAEVVDAKTVRVAITVDPKAGLGERDFRLTGPGGVSNRHRFFIGELPEVNETEPNNKVEQPQAITTLPVLVNGQVMEKDRDYYRFPAKAGQVLVFDLVGRRIQPYIADAVPAWLEASLVLYGTDGRKLADDDDFRFRPDPLLIYKVAEDGEYTLEVNDVLFRGRADFVYRLSIGELPYITHAFPLGAQRGKAPTFQLRGFNLPSETLELAIPADSAPLCSLGVERDGLHSNPLPVAASDWPDHFETEPADPSSSAAEVALPVAINGRIDRPGDVDLYTFPVAAGQQLVMEVQARRLESPLDAVLTLSDSSGRTLAENDDTIDLRLPLVTHHADSRLLYTFASEGNYTLNLRDAQARGGEEYAYRILIGPPQPDYTLRVSPDNLRIGPGETAMVSVNAMRTDGFKGEIVLTVEGLPEGFAVSEAVLSPGQDQVSLTITAPAEAALGVVSPSIVGTAMVEDKPLVRHAEAAESVMQAFSWTHIVPTQEYSLAVVKTPDAPFELAVALDADKPLELPQGGELALPVKLTRDEGGTFQVSLSAIGLPPGITAKAALIAADQTEGVLTLEATPRAPAGLLHNVVIRGSMRSGKVGITSVLPALRFTVVSSPP